MAKSHTKYTCQQCGYVSPKYLGRCPQCAEWNSLVESIESTRQDSKTQRLKDSSRTAKPVMLSDIKQETKERFETNISELDHVLGGGLVSGQVVLLAGEPGVGKSTLLLQVVKELSSKFKVQSSNLNTRISILYASGEESPEQISLRARRLNFTKKDNESLILYPETNVENIVEVIKKLSNKVTREDKTNTTQGSSLNYSITQLLTFLIIDSIQTMWSGKLTGAPGSVGQVRECAYEIIQAAKRLQVPAIIVGQVTKEGSIAGPKVLEHLVDTVLYMEGSRFEETRIVRVSKNRFGPTDEVGVFEMKEDGLHALSNPSSSFVSKRSASLPGQTTVVVMEGTRPLLVEIQALVSPSELKSPRRVGNGVSVNRLTMLCAILSKHLKMPLERFDVYVNVSGGLTISEPAADLGIALSIYSSFKNKALPEKSVAIGELTLLGEIQEVARIKRRISEAKRMGYTNILSVNNIKHITSFPSL